MFPALAIRETCALATRASPESPPVEAAVVACEIARVVSPPLALTLVIVVPAGIPTPVTGKPAVIPDALPATTMVRLPFVNLPLKPIAVAVVVGVEIWSVVSLPLALTWVIVVPAAIP
jgi:hypothetical protein